MANLIDDPWLPVVVDGRRCQMSLLEALTNAHTIDGVGLEDPLQAVAAFRQVVLPAYLDALGVPRTGREWQQRWEAADLGEEVLRSYLAEHAHRFRVFDPACPFAQVAGLHTPKNETKPVSALMPAVAAGNNVPLFGFRTDDDPPALSPAEAIRAALSTQCWDTAAIKSGAVDDPAMKAGKTTGNPTGPLGQLGVILPLGRTLKETILLNTPIVAAGLSPADRPAWRADPAGPAWETRSELGILDLLTWQSRRIRLLPEGDDTNLRVRQVVLAAGDRLTRVPADRELHTAWRRDPKPRAGQEPVRPVRHQPGRAAWRGLEAMLTTTQPQSGTWTSSLLIQLGNLKFDGLLAGDYPLQVLTVGVVYGNQSAIVEDVLVDSVPLPVAALTDSLVHDLLLDVVRQAEQLRLAADRLVDDLRRAAGGDKVARDKGSRLGDQLMHELSATVRRLLAGLQQHPDRVDDADAAWRTAARATALRVAEPVLADSPPETFLGRERDGRVYRLTVAAGHYTSAVGRALGLSRSGSTTIDPGVRS